MEKDIKDIDLVFFLENICNIKLKHYQKILLNILCRKEKNYGCNGNDKK